MNRVNQQERLTRSEQLKYFLAGFIEGEGSLTVSCKAHKDSRFGFYLDPEFFLYQHKSGRELLELTRELFQTGRIYPKPGNPMVLVYAITDRRSLKEKVVPYFERYVFPFSCKKQVFIAFKEIIELFERKEHLQPLGFIKMTEIAYQMNPDSKGKKRLRTLTEIRERILRDHTSDPLRRLADGGKI